MTKQTLFPRMALALALAAGALAAHADDDHSRPSNWTSPGPGAVDFGSVQTGQSSNSQVVVVRNSGNGPVTYLGFSLAAQTAGGNFQVAAMGTGGLPPCAAKAVMAPGASCGLTVTFQPAAGSAGGGAKTAWLTPSFQATAPSGTGTVAGSSPGARLAGTGVLPSGAVTPARLDFELQAAGSDAPAQFLTLTNNGLGPLVFVGARLDAYSTKTGTFALAPAANGAVAACSPAQPLPPGGSCSLRVGYHALQLGTSTSRVLVDLGGGAATAVGPSLTGRAALPVGATQHH